MGGGLDTTGDFPPFLKGGQQLCIPVCVFANQAPSEKAATLKGKNMVSKDTFSPFRVDSFQKGENNLTVLPSVLPPLKCINSP